MKLRYAAALTVFLLVIVPSAHAELYEGRVQGIPGKFGESDHKGFSVVLVDFGDSKLVHGILTIDKDLGPIETASLMVYDNAKKETVVVAILPEKIEGKIDFEFHLSRGLLANSFVEVSHRDKDNLYIAKVLLGTFSVVDKSKH